MYTVSVTVHFSKEYNWCKHRSDAACRGGSRGARAPLFLAKSILFFTLYAMSEKIFLKLNFDFIVAEIQGVFGSEKGVCVCVCVYVIP